MVMLWDGVVRLSRSHRRGKLHGEDWGKPASPWMETRDGRSKKGKWRVQRGGALGDKTIAVWWPYFVGQDQKVKQPWRSPLPQGLCRASGTYTDLTTRLWSVENVKGGKQTGSGCVGDVAWWGRGGVRREGQEKMTRVVISGPITNDDGWLRRGKRNSVYLKVAIKKICGSRGRMAVPILAVDVSDEAGLIHLQTDTAALMWLKIAVLRPSWSCGSASSPVCSWMQIIPLWLKIISIWFLPRVLNHCLPLSAKWVFKHQFVVWTSVHWVIVRCINLMLSKFPLVFCAGLFFLMPNVIAMICPIEFMYK